MALTTKMTMSDLQACLIKYELDTNVFVSLNRFFFICGFSAKAIFAFLVLRVNGETHRNKHFSSQKNDGCLPHFLPDKAFKDNVSIRALSSLHGGSQLKLRLQTPQGRLKSRT